MKRYFTKKEIGNYGELLAVRYLRLRGYAVKEQNWFSGKCELDIVATTLRDVVFVEVKTRTYEGNSWRNAPPPSLAVNSEKQRHTRAAAQSYLYQHPTHKCPRMDVIEVYLQKNDTGKRPRLLEIRHIKAAY